MLLLIHVGKAVRVFRKGVEVGRLVILKVTEEEFIILKTMPGFKM